MPKIYASVRLGAPFPVGITDLIDETVFEQLKAECRAANREADMNQIIFNYNVEHNWFGGVSGYEERNSSVDITIGNLFYSSTFQLI